MNAARIRGDVLKLCPQRSKILDALQGTGLSPRVEADLGVASRNHLAYGFAGLHSGHFRFDLIVDAQFLQHADEVGAARSGRVGYRLRRKNRFFTASAELISGLGAPTRTATPMPDFARIAGLWR